MLLSNLMELLFASILTLLMLIVLYTDVRWMLIHNWLNILVAALFPIAALTLPHETDWLMSLAAAAAFFAGGLALFSFNIMGGGDVKLLGALGLWLGWSMAAVNFLVYMSFMGGVATVFLLLLRVAIKKLSKKPDAERIECLRTGAPVPYGIAIALGFLVVLWAGEVPMLGQIL